MSCKHGHNAAHFCTACYSERLAAELRESQARVGSAESLCASLRTQVEQLTRERDEAREMLDGSVTDTAFAAWKESADVRIAEAEAKLAKSEAANSQARALVERAERLVNDNPNNGPGAPHVPGLCEIRDALTALKSSPSGWRSPEEYAALEKELAELKERK